MDDIRKFIKNKPYIIWYSKNYDGLSKESILESVLNYGNWNDYLFIENALGIKKVNSVFSHLKNQKRINLRPQTINYFSNYFKVYA
ncbi:MAG: hypothetical protein ACD_19C00176G0040 [uncultured bacterium]|nr:MAG: hypothetical protein ACD_19C00176G0040 [uncultured bacterium]